MAMNLIEKLKGPEGMQYLLGAALVLVIVVSLAALILGGDFFSDSNRPQTPTELHFYDVVKKEEFVVPYEKMEEYLTPDIMMLPPFMQYVKSDVNGGKKTALPMEQCPACKEYFVPESWLKARGNPQAMTDMKRVCTKCGTDVDEWYREQYRKKKKNK